MTGILQHDGMSNNPPVHDNSSEIRGIYSLSIRKDEVDNVERYDKGVAINTIKGTDLALEYGMSLAGNEKVHKTANIRMKFRPFLKNR